MEKAYKKIIIKPTRPSRGIWHYKSDGTVTYSRKLTKKMKELFRQMRIDVDE